MLKPQFVIARSISIKQGFLGISLLFLSGFAYWNFTSFKRSNADLQCYIQEVRHRIVRKMESFPFQKPLAPFKFLNQGKRRNPFEAINGQKQRIRTASSDKNGGSQFLESFPLDDLKCVGTLRQGTIRWGLIKLPDSSIAPVHIDQYLGLSKGRVVRIKNDAIQLIETIQSSGKWKRHRSTMSCLDEAVTQKMRRSGK